MRLAGALSLAGAWVELVLAVLNLRDESPYAAALNLGCAVLYRFCSYYFDRRKVRVQ